MRSDHLNPLKTLFLFAGLSMAHRAPRLGSCLFALCQSNCLLELYCYPENKHFPMVSLVPFVFRTLWLALPHLPETLHPLLPNILHGRVASHTRTRVSILRNPLCGISARLASGPGVQVQEAFLPQYQQVRESHRRDGGREPEQRQNVLGFPSITRREKTVEFHLFFRYIKTKNQKTFGLHFNALPPSLRWTPRSPRYPPGGRLRWTLRSS